MTIDHSANIHERLAAAEAALHAVGQQLSPALRHVDIAVLIPAFNEATTIASVWTHNQFIEGTVEKRYLVRATGHPEKDAFHCDASISEELGAMGTRGIDEVAEADEDMAGYILQLEKARDELQSAEGSGDVLAKEFEKFLRDSGASGESDTNTDDDSQNGEAPKA